MSTPPALPSLPPLTPLPAPALGSAAVYAAVASLNEVQLRSAFWSLAARYEFAAGLSRAEVDERILALLPIKAEADK